MCGGDAQRGCGHPGRRHESHGQEQRGKFAAQRLTGLKALESDIREWAQNWNEDPRPFTWNKTAEEILYSFADSLAKVTPTTKES